MNLDNSIDSEESFPPFQVPKTVVHWTPVLTCPLAFGELEDGRTAVLTVIDDAASSYTLDRNVTVAAGLKFVDRNVVHVQLVKQLTKNDIMLAKVGALKPRPKLLGIQCANCGLILASNFSYERHAKLHGTDQVVCSECDCVFDDDHYFNTHLKKCVFCCPFSNSAAKCDFVSKTKKGVEAHMQRFHRYEETAE